MPPSRVVLFSGRMLFIRLLLLGAFFVLVLRLIFLQVYQDNFLDEQVLSRSHSEYSLLANRGKILDRNNNILALDVRSFSVGVDLNKFKGNISNIGFLEEILDLKKGALNKLIERKKTGYKEIKRHITGDLRKDIESLGLEGIFFKENLDKSKKRIAKRVKKGFQGYPQISIAYWGQSVDCATDVVVGYISEEGAAIQEQKFSSKGDARKDETIQTTLLKVIERAGAKTVVEVAGVSIIKP